MNETEDALFKELNEVQNELKVTLVDRMGMGKLDNTSGQEGMIKLMIEANKDLTKFAEEHPGVAYLLHLLDEQATVVQKTLDRIEKQSQSFPLKQYSYSKKSQAIN